MPVTSLQRENPTRESVLAVPTALSRVCRVCVQREKNGSLQKIPGHLNKGVGCVTCDTCGDDRPAVLF